MSTASVPNEPTTKPPVRLATMKAVEPKALLDASDSAPLSLPQVPATEVEPEPEVRAQPRPQRRSAPSQPRDSQRDTQRVARQENPRETRPEKPREARPEKLRAPRQESPVARQETAARAKPAPKPATKPVAPSHSDDVRAAAKDLTARLRAAGSDYEESAPPPRKPHEKGRKPK